MLSANIPGPVRRVPAVVLVLYGALWVSSEAPQPAVVFQKHVIDAAFTNGYQVSIADLDSDGDADVVALSTQPSQLVWYRNPDWARLNISTRTQRNIDCAPNDIDGDGDADLVVASDFDLGNSQQGGTLQWLENPGDPVAQQEWDSHPVAAIPTSHRVRWIDLEGDGKKELINLPIIGVGATPPDYAVGVELRAYRVPSDLSGPWASELLDDTLCMAHGLLVAPWDAGALPEVFTASFDGVHRFRWKEGAATKVQIGLGHPDARPAQGSSEVGIGRLRNGASHFAATIEPWHGNEVVVYAGGESDVLPWGRTVIDTSLSDGHGLVCLDVDGDGSDEIIAGGRGGAHDLLQFRWSAGGWQRSVVDPDGIAVAGITIADLNQDGRPDLVATGTATHNVIWYENLIDSR